MLRERDVDDLEPWLTAVARSELRAFAAGIRRHRDAVLAVICFCRSNGQVEGQVHRLKLIKRPVYGRAGLSLLRARVIHVA